MKLSATRFPDTIIRRRSAPGDYDVHGEWRAGAVTETTLRASVQPLRLEDIDAAGGARLSDRRKCFVARPDALRAASETAAADRVVVAGVEFVVQESMSWRAHCKAILLRES